MTYLQGKFFQKTHSEIERLACKLELQSGARMVRINAPAPDVEEIFD